MGYCPNPSASERYKWVPAGGLFMRFHRWSNCDLVAARSLIPLAASRLALRAPALRAATALTRPNGSAQWLPCGRHGVPTAVTVGPNDVVANHGVEHSDHLAHHRHDRDLRQFAGVLEATVEPLEHGIPITGAHRLHEEDVADVRAATPDATPSFELATFKGVGRYAHQSGHLLAAHAAELGQKRNQGATQQWPDPGHGCEQLVSVRERGIGRNNLDQALIEHRDIGGEASDATAGKTLQHRIFQQSGGILGGDFWALSWRRTASISTSR